MKTEEKGIYIGVLSAVLIGFGNVFGAEAAKNINPIYLAMLASLVTGIIFLAGGKILRFDLKIKEAVTRYRKEILSISILRSSLGSLILIIGFSMTSAIRAVFLLRLEPLFVVLASYIILKEKITAKQFLFIFILISGAFLLSTGGDISVLTETQIGDFLVVLAVIFFTYTYFPGAKVSRKLGAITVNAITNMLGGLILIPIVLLFVPMNSFFLSNYSMLLFGGYIVFLYMIGITLWFVALRTVKEWIVSSILSIGSIVGALLAFLWLGDVLSPLQLIGAAIILVASSLISMQRK